MKLFNYSLITELIQSFYEGSSNRVNKVRNKNNNKTSKYIFYKVKIILTLHFRYSIIYIKKIYLLLKNNLQTH